jgi:alpha-amylase
MGSNGDYVAKHGYDNCTGLGSIYGIRLANSLQGIMTDISESDIPVTGIQLNQTTLQLPIHTTATLVATVTPVNATSQTILWNSSNTSVATVSNNGIVAAVRDGSATITVITTDQTFTATCLVTVIIPRVPVASVSIIPNTVSLGLKKITTLTAVILPTNATDKRIVWTSSNPSVVSIGLVSYTNPKLIPSVDSNSTIITMMGSGQATITAICDSVGATSSITVIPPINSIALLPANLSMRVGSTSQTTVIFTPSQSAIPITLWNSSNVKVATVDRNGLVSALKAGTTIITAGINGKTATRYITVL